MPERKPRGRRERYKEDAERRAERDESLVAFARVANHDLRVLLSEWLGFPSIQILLDRHKGISLTNLTVPELVQLKRALDLAFELAFPVAAMIDEDVTERFEAGDDRPFSRLYRGAPQFAFRERVLTEHYKGVQGGPERVADVVRRYAPHDTGGMRGLSGAIRDGAPADVGGEDDATETGGDPDVGA